MVIKASKGLPVPLVILASKEQLGQLVIPDIKELPALLENKVIKEVQV